jgi:hypothetical protein
MPKSIAHKLSDEALAARRREWAERVTKAWLAKHPPASSEHISKKPFTVANLVRLADLATFADDIRVEEIRANGNTLPGPGTWMPGPQMWFVIQMLYAEFGYVVSFLAFVRQRAAPGFGFAGAGFRGGKARLTPRVSDRYLRNPFFVALVRSRAEKRNEAPGMKDVVNLIEELGPFVAPKNAASEATRKKR